jgi:AraC-like DNA-binding protein
MNRSPFCEELNLCEKTCAACIETNRRLMKEAEVNGPTTCHCFAGLCATAVPVKMGASVIGYLKTGQVFSRTPTPDQFEAIMGAIGRKTLNKVSRKKLKEAYMQTRFVEPLRYQSMVTLLQSFAEQLSEHAESLAIIEEGSEPAAIAKARKFIHEHLDQPLPLGLVARHAGLSESHFCRLFKDSAGLTLTDYVNRCRIDWAKRELLKPEARISRVSSANRPRFTAASASNAPPRDDDSRHFTADADGSPVNPTPHGRQIRNSRQDRPRRPWRGLPRI